MFKRFLLGVMIVVSIMLGAQELGYCEDDNSKKEKKVAKKGYFLYYGGKELKEGVVYYDKKRKYYFRKDTRWKRILKSKYRVFFPNRKAEKIRDVDLKGEVAFINGCKYLGLTRDGKIRIETNKYDNKKKANIKKIHTLDPKYMIHLVRFPGKKVEYITKSIQDGIKKHSKITISYRVRNLEELKGAKRIDFEACVKHMTVDKLGIKMGDM